MFREICKIIAYEAIDYYFCLAHNPCVFQVMKYLTVQEEKYGGSDD